MKNRRSRKRKDRRRRVKCEGRRGADQWGEMSKIIKQNAEGRVREISTPGSGVDVGYVDVNQEIFAITLQGSDSELQKTIGEYREP